MSIVETVSNPYGPATMDIQIEQGCDIDWTITVQTGIPPEALDITGYTFTAEFSPQWAPGASSIPFEVDITDPTNGVINVSLAGSVTLDANFPLPNPPFKTFTTRQRKSRVYALGGWALYMTDTAGFRTQLIQGVVQFNRDPSSGG